MTTFVDTLPAPRTLARHHENVELADELRANPGRWVLYPYPLDRPHGLRYRIAHGKDAAFGPGFAAKVRNGNVYIAYVGDGAAQ